MCSNKSDQDGDDFPRIASYKLMNACRVVERGK